MRLSHLGSLKGGASHGFRREEILLAAAGSRRAARIVALVGFAVQALAVVLFASTMQPYATTLMFALLLAKVVVGYRILRS